jgi:hypothetical protein
MVSIDPTNFRDTTREQGFTTEGTEGAQRDTGEGCLDFLFISLCPVW